MKKEFNDTTEFEFQESPGEFEFREGVAEFGEVTEELKDKSAVIILTNNYCINGEVALVPGARLTDYIVGAKSFIAVINAEVKDKAGNLILKTSFLNISRDHIEIILPAELAEVKP